MFLLSCNSTAVSLQVEQESLQTTYTENDRSMLRYVYDCIFFVARKPREMFSNAEEVCSPPAAKAQRHEDADSPT